VSEPGSTPAGGYKDKNRKTVRAAERSQIIFCERLPSISCRYSCRHL